MIVTPLTHTSEISILPYLFTVHNLPGMFGSRRAVPKLRNLVPDASASPPPCRSKSTGIIYDRIARMKDAPAARIVANWRRIGKS